MKLDANVSAVVTGASRIGLPSRAKIWARVWTSFWSSLPDGPTAIRKVVGRSNRYSVPAATPNRKMPAARIRSA